VQPRRPMELAAPTPSMRTWHHCSPYVTLRAGQSPSGASTRHM